MDPDIVTLVDNSSLSESSGASDEQLTPDKLSNNNLINTCDAATPARLVTPCDSGESANTELGDMTAPGMNSRKSGMMEADIQKVNLRYSLKN